jgi:bifunctional DNase/RNase
LSDVRMNVWKVLYDSSLGSSVVLLQSQDGDRVLPIWVGQSEALSIAVASENIKMARPMTHDLLKTFVETVGMSIEWIRVTELRDGTFFAVIRAATKHRSFDLDSRPSDAIALALRVEAPIFVAEQVLAEAMGTDFSSLKSIEDLEEDFLANLPDEIFGKYKM